MRTWPAVAVLVGLLFVSAVCPARGDAPPGNRTTGRTEGPPRTVTFYYPVPSGDAEAVVKLLREVFKGVPWMRIWACGPDAIIVSAPPDDQLDIRDVLRPVRPVRLR
jgi:hypothetical protein